jgi:hypothetical protein
MGEVTNRRAISTDVDVCSLGGISAPNKMILQAVSTAARSAVLSIGHPYECDAGNHHIPAKPWGHQGDCRWWRSRANLLHPSFLGGNGDIHPGF